MSKAEMMKRISQLNKIIDKKIINGGSTKKEEAEHANLYHFLKSAK